MAVKIIAVRTPIVATAGRHCLGVDPPVLLNYKGSGKGISNVWTLPGGYRH